MDKPYLNGKPAWVKSYSVMKKRGPVNRRVKSFKGEYAAENFVKTNAGEKYFIVEEYVDSGEKQGSKPNYNSDFTMVFPRMYSSTASHIGEYKKWSNYKDSIRRLTTPARCWRWPCRVLISRRTLRTTSSQQAWPKRSSSVCFAACSPITGSGLTQTLAFKATTSFWCATLKRDK